ncbi:hypothetical protein ACIRPQ_34610 [Streptomyces sp. NPDC101213]|uniref:hypothetical protein n=1 Tax=Streptomyces sp. NPDC101213 TaxID=3366130 RepID=UPI00381E1C21
MNNQERDQKIQAPVRPQAQAQEARGEFAKRGALAAISGAFSGAARAVVTHMLGNGS